MAKKIQVFPVKLWHPAAGIKPLHMRDADDPDGVKTISARSQDELDTLLRLGWKIKDNQ